MSNILSLKLLIILWFHFHIFRVYDMSHLRSVSKYSIHHFLEGRDDGGDNFSRHNLSPHKHPTIGEKGRSSNSTQDCSAFAAVHISTKIRVESAFTYLLLFHCYSKRKYEDLYHQHSVLSKIAQAWAFK